ncbi:MAG: glycoside hydrolase [Anaerolineae bacterium]|nr:glycoside hydrolase [Anaerolineae bacterium]
MSSLRRSLMLGTVLCMLLTSCQMPTTAPGTPVAASTPVFFAPAFESGDYRNLFAEYLGKSDAEIQAKVETAFQQFFYGDEYRERVYYPVGEDMAYILDTGNDDVRSEGMSYGMMIAVQLDKQEEFNRLWKWTKTHMYQTGGGYKGYFAWHCEPDGTTLDANPASDGEVWFITALIFADARWGSGEGIFNYRAEAQSILDVALHADQLSGDIATNLFDSETKQVVFVPMLGKNSQFTDPSYHMPHYYELWARWADKDNDFWAEAVTASRAYLKTAVHPETGLAPNYSYFDGSPYNDDYHGKFRYDAFRVGANIGVDYAWFRPDDWHREQASRLLGFFAAEGLDAYKAEYTLEGESLVEHRSTGLMATNAVAALAADPEIGKPFVQALWDLKLPTGTYRYYDGLLTMLALLQVSGNFRIYMPA